MPQLNVPGVLIWPTPPPIEPNVRLDAQAVGRAIDLIVSTSNNHDTTLNGHDAKLQALEVQVAGLMKRMTDNETFHRWVETIHPEVIHEFITAQMVAARLDGQ